MQRDNARSFEVEKPTFIAVRMTDGLAFGEGKISGQDGDPEMLRTIDHTIETDPNILVPVDVDDSGMQLDDDGCGDGREVGLIMRGAQFLKRSLNRAKVFGGAVAMTAGSRIGMGLSHGVPLQEVMDSSIEQLETRQINFGAHTADHVAPGREAIDSGCGALDGAPAVVRAVVKFETSIREALKGLAVDETGLDDIFAQFRAYAAELPEESTYSGKAVMQRITSLGKVVKELVGGHKERRIVLNSVRGYTVNQALIREVTGGEAQVFATDTWRLADIAEKLYPGEPAKQQQAFLSELVYTLGVAAVLTPGDMPVYHLQTAA